MVVAVAAAAVAAAVAEDRFSRLIQWWGPAELMVLTRHAHYFGNFLAWKRAIFRHLHVWSFRLCPSRGNLKQLGNRIFLGNKFWDLTSLPLAKLQYLFSLSIINIFESFAHQTFSTC
jgi:hypothetical protein